MFLSSPLGPHGRIAAWSLHCNTLNQWLHEEESNLKTNMLFTSTETCCVTPFGVGRLPALYLELPHGRVAARSLHCNTLNQWLHEEESNLKTNMLFTSTETCCVTPFGVGRLPALYLELPHGRIAAFAPALLWFASPLQKPSFPPPSFCFLSFLLQACSACGFYCGLPLHCRSPSSSSSSRLLFWNKLAHAPSLFQLWFSLWLATPLQKHSTDSSLTQVEP